MIKIYHYKGCETCRKALSYLDKKGLRYTVLPIREQPPTETELETMLSFYEGNLRRLFNTSGQDYKKMNLKDKVSSMSKAEALRLLSKNGNLVKRPFVLAGKRGMVGFKEEEWEKFLG